MVTEDSTWDRAPRTAINQESERRSTQPSKVGWWMDGWVRPAGSVDGTREWGGTGMRCSSERGGYTHGYGW